MTARLFVSLQICFLLITGVICDAQLSVESGVQQQIVARSFKAVARQGDNSLIKSNVDLVFLPVTITDQNNRYVTGLRKEDFRVFEGKNEQAVEHFSIEDTPISIGVIFDASGSMSQNIELGRQAIKKFIAASKPQDEFFLVAVNNRPRLLVDFTDSVDVVQNEIVDATPRGTTALLDAVYLGLNQMKRAKYQRRVLLVISDGKDNHSRYTLPELTALLKETDIQVYAIGVVDGVIKSKVNRQGQSLLARLTDITGGRTFPNQNPKVIDETAAELGNELRNQYLLAYHPKDLPRDGRWRKVRIQVKAAEELKRLRVYAKQGYYAPMQ